MGPGGSPLGENGLGTSERTGVSTASRRWRNAAQWARNSMIHEGLLKADSPRGVWEISDQGRRALPVADDETRRDLAKDSGDDRQGQDSEEVISLEPETNESLTFTRVLQAQFGKRVARNWNDLVTEGVRAAKDAGLNLLEVRRLLSVQIAEGTRKDAGYHTIPGTGWSIQGMETNRAWENTLKLAKRLRCHVEVRFRWSGKGAYPNRDGVIRWRPVS